MSATTTFESTTCGRCAGSGRHSFNLLHGDTCYGCNGRGVKFTKRGRVAHDWFSASLHKPIEEVEIGDRLYQSPGPVSAGGWYTVDELGTYTARSNGREVEGILVRGEGKRGRLGEGGFPGGTIRVSHTGERKRELIAEALALQATLTKQGNPRKR